MWKDAEEKTEKFVAEFIENKVITVKQYWSISKTEGYNPDANVLIYIQDAANGRDISQIGLDENEVLYERKSKFLVVANIFQDGIFYYRRSRYGI